MLLEICCYRKETISVSISYTPQLRSKIQILSFPGSPSLAALLRGLSQYSLSNLSILQWRHHFCTAPIDQIWILQLRQITSRKRIYWSGFAKNAIANVLKVVPVNSNRNFQLLQHVPHTAYPLYASCIQLYFLYSKSKVRHL